MATLDRWTTTIDGLPVRDAAESIVIHITGKDVTAKGRKHPDMCAIAMACSRELGAEARVHLSRVYLRFGKSRRWERFVTPRSLRDEIIAFDRGGKFEIGEYTLSAPQPTQRLGVDRRVAKRPPGSGNPNGKRRTAHHVPNVRPLAGGPTT